MAQNNGTTRDELNKMNELLQQQKSQIDSVAINLATKLDGLKGSVKMTDNTVEHIAKKLGIDAQPKTWKQKLWSGIKGAAPIVGTSLLTAALVRYSMGGSADVTATIELPPASPQLPQ